MFIGLPRLSDKQYVVSSREYYDVRVEPWIEVRKQEHDFELAMTCCNMA